MQRLWESADSQYIPQSLPAASQQPAIVFASLMTWRFSTWQWVFAALHKEGTLKPEEDIRSCTVLQIFTFFFFLPTNATTQHVWPSTHISPAHDEDSMVGRKWSFQCSFDYFVKPFLILISKTAAFLDLLWKRQASRNLGGHLKCITINHSHKRPTKAIKMTLGAWTVLSSLSSLVCAYKTGRCGKERQKEIERERPVRSTGPGQGSVGRSDEVGGPLQEVAPQHEGRGCTPPNEGWSGAPCGTPSGTFIKRWKSDSRGRASACLGSDMFNLGPYENTRPYWPGLLLSVRGINNTKPELD